MKQRHAANNYEKTKAWMAQTSRSLAFAALLFLTLLVTGVAGYRVIEGWPLIDSLYMTVITISTVGYGEVQPLTNAGRLFSALLIISGMGVVAYCINIFAQTMIEGQINRLRGMSKMFRKIRDYENHHIVCGYGRLSKYVLPELIDHGHKVVVIDSDPMSTIELEALQIPYVEGNAYDNETLKVAGVERANALLSLLPNDSDNVYVTLSARSLNPKLRIVARTESSESEDKLRLAGANTVVAPFRVSGARIVQQLLHPSVNDFLEIATGKGGESLIMERLIIPTGSCVAGLTLEQSEIRKKTGVIVAASIESDGTMNLSPGRDSVLSAGSTLIALGTKKNLEDLAELV
jgi:voltage-gated potassium channel